MAGAAIVLACIALAVLAPFVAPYGPEETHPNWKLFAPNQYFVFGTDEFGRDILSRIVFGARISLEVGLISVSLALVLGASAGLLAGFLGGWLDGLTMRCMDVLFAFPAILLAIGIMAVLGTGIVNAMLAIGIVYAPSFARLARASAVVEGVGVRPGRAGTGPRRAGDPGAAYRAERARADDRADEFQSIHGDSDRSVAELSGAGHTAVDTVMGLDVELQPALCGA